MLVIDYSNAFPGPKVSPFIMAMTKNAIMKGTRACFSKL